MPPSNPPLPDPPERNNGFKLWKLADDGASLRLAVSGEVDIASADEFRQQLDRFIDGTATQVTLDMCGCTFIDSTGIQVLVKVAREQRAQGRPLALSGLAPLPLRVLEVTGLLDSDLFATYPKPPPSDE